MKKMVLGMWLLCAVAPAAETSMQRVEKALADSEKTGRLVLVQYAAHWCYFCKLMDQETLSDPLIMRKLSKYERVELDYDQSRLLAIKHGVTGIPSFVLLDSNGSILKRILGYQEPPVFDNWLNQASDHKFLARIREERLKVATTKLRKVFEQGDATARRNAIDVMFERLNIENKTQSEFLRAQLDLIVDAYPQDLVFALKHQQLSIRIEVANAYRKKLGDAFAFDPWTTGDALEAAYLAAKQVVLP